MRSRVSEMDAAPESERKALSLSPSPPPRVGVNLSSMVVKPPASSGVGSDLDIGYPADDRDSPPHQRRLNSLQYLHPRVSPSYARRRGSSSPAHRRISPEGFGHRVLRNSLIRRRSPIDVHRHRSPLGFHPRSPRFLNDAGFMHRPGSISPPRRPRADDGYYEPDFDHPRVPHSARGMRGRGGGRFRDISPPFGRGGGSHARGLNSYAHGASSLKGDFVHRNDPNLSPREGDWICQNPSCGNLNFARRTNCNNCHKYRYDEPYGSNHSPRKGYVSPPLHRSYSPKLSVSPIDRAPRRGFNVYKSPPPRAVRDLDPAEFNTNLIPPRRGGKFFQPIRRGNLRERGRPDCSPGGGWERRSRGAFIDEEHRVNRNTLSPHDRLIRDTRGRSRSPVGGRLPNGSFVGRSRDDRRYDGPYAKKGRSDNFNAARGGGYKHGGSWGRSPNVF